MLLQLPRTAKPAPRLAKSLFQVTCSRQPRWHEGVAVGGQELTSSRRYDGGSGRQLGKLPGRFLLILRGTRRRSTSQTPALIQPPLKLPVFCIMSIVTGSRCVSALPHPKRSAAMLSVTTARASDSPHAMTANDATRHQEGQQSLRCRARGAEWANGRLIHFLNAKKCQPAVRRVGRMETVGRRGGSRGDLLAR